MIENLAFTTDRLRVGPWHVEAARVGADLVAVLTGLLTPSTTGELPPAWHGSFDSVRAAAWIAERDGQSPTLLITERESDLAVGLLILHDEPIDEDFVDLRVGYLLAEERWGRGLATELVAGLVAWARARPEVRTITGGVARTNPASATVLSKCGFEVIGVQGDEEIHRLTVAH